MREFPVQAGQQAAPSFTIEQHTFDLQLQHGQTRVGIDSRSGRGTFTCHGQQGYFQTRGKCVTEYYSHAWPIEVWVLLEEHGYDTSGVVAA